jgi:hypothetical protein
LTKSRRHKLKIPEHTRVCEDFLDYVNVEFGKKIRFEMDFYIKKKRLDIQAFDLNEVRKP